MPEGGTQAPQRSQYLFTLGVNGPINLLSDRLLRYILIFEYLSDFGARFGSRYQNKNIRRYLRGPSESRLIGPLLNFK